MYNIKTLSSTAKKITENDQKMITKVVNKKFESE